MKLNKKFIKIVFENYVIRHTNLVSDAYENGCHGITGHDNEQELIEQAILDYLKLQNGESVEKSEKQMEKSKGVYINSPQWNM